MLVATAVRRWMKSTERQDDPTANVILAAAMQLDGLGKDRSPESARATPALARLIRQLIVSLDDGTSGVVVDERVRDIQRLM